jgi:hypothetical protein
MIVRVLCLLAVYAALDSGSAQAFEAGGGRNAPDENSFEAVVPSPPHCDPRMHDCRPDPVLYLPL